MGFPKNVLPISVCVSLGDSAVLKDVSGNSSRSRKSCGDRISRKRTRKKGPQAVNPLTIFVNQAGASLENDLRLSPEFDLKSELLNVRVKSLTKTDFWSVPIPKRLNARLVSIIIFLNNSSGIIRIGSLRNPLKIGLRGLVKRLMTFLKV